MRDFACSWLGVYSPLGRRSTLGLYMRPKIQWERAGIFPAFPDPMDSPGCRADCRFAPSSPSVRRDGRPSPLPNGVRSWAAVSLFFTRASYPRTDGGRLLRRSDVVPWGESEGPFGLKQFAQPVGLSRRRLATRKKSRCSLSFSQK